MDRESSVYGRPNTFKYTMFIDDEITAPCDYRDEFDLLENAQEGDVVVININSGGGRLDTTLQFIALMDSCQGHVVTKLAGQACSGAAMIFLAGHELQVAPLSELMAHSASGGYGGKVSDLAAFAKHNESHVANVMENVYRGFLTEEEIEELHKGKEFWMRSDEINERLHKRADLFKQEHEDKQKAAYDEMFAEFEADEIPDEILKKLTKSQLIDYIKDEIDIVINEDGSFEIVDVEEIEQ
jgi:ATP-dependent protease ClpP protease subunit